MPVCNVADRTFPGGEVNMQKTRQLAYGEKAEPGLNIRLAMEEASRCLLCEDAPCSRDCPAGTDPGRFIRSIRFRNFKGAASA